ncbi:NAD-dependent protein deacetylase sirtuin-7 [Pelomyxa schiedti]|nr:NAD-dependent protein deacetylase sirtuin-7 [Pelomyxa schiedti]
MSTTTGTAPAPPPPPGTPEAEALAASVAASAATSTTTASGSSAAAEEGEVMTGETWERMHGNRGDPGWAPPRVVMHYDVNARHTFTGIKAHEYTDQPEVMAAKVDALVRMVRKSSALVAYTGAGISTAAGIDDYATKSRAESAMSHDASGAERPKVKDWKLARPTKAHRVLAALFRAGILKHWVQQNHDSLPQKAGYPQYALNEIHGSLHDPANPIVPYEGQLRPDLCAWMNEWKKKADMCIALGTSMSGFTADSVPKSIAKRGYHHPVLCQGLVIINLQQTPYDEWAALRIYGRVDDVLTALVDRLGLGSQVSPMDTPLYTPNLPADCIVGEEQIRVPFNAQGEPCSTRSKQIVWDLHIGKHVKLTGGPYGGDIGKIAKKNEQGHYRIDFAHSINPTFNVVRRPFSLWFGSWWLEMAATGHGIVPGGKIPFVNVTEEEAAAAAAKANAVATAGAKNLGKYSTMLKVGLPEPVVRQKMQNDGVDAPIIDQFFVDAKAKSSS